MVRGGEVAVNAETRRVLRETRHRLIDRGWRKLSDLDAGLDFGSDEGPSCLFLTTEAVAFDLDELADEADSLLLTALGLRHIGEGYKWNDAQPSVEPVIALLDKVLSERNSDEAQGIAGPSRRPQGVLDGNAPVSRSESASRAKLRSPEPEAHEGGSAWPGSDEKDIRRVPGRGSSSSGVLSPESPACVPDPDPRVGGEHGPAGRRRSSSEPNPDASRASLHLVADPPDPERFGSASETCPTCGRPVTWVDHLPPLRSGEPVRCYVLTGKALA